LPKYAFIILVFLSVSSCKSPQVESASYNLLLQALLDSQVPAISVSELKQLESVVLLDSRSKEEFDVSHISNAIYVGFEDFDISKVAHLDKNQTIVVYCSVGYRSENITCQLIDNGFEDVSNLYGGIFEWVNQGNGIVNMDGEITDRIHPYSRTWGIWLRRGEKAYEIN
jgi:rhodanese-related sulfurtransferase